ncbi:hypothetical protein [Kitasatospora cathayae]|uniref:Major facilitator superfamily (MFS) profile domain-containing protein n=1 Tax=Kitasatospora cathayae TaxID=3004092 RepID=A0ABY7QCC8_9ACTN|nr:hypothetical protein [Kitasatospora sp. HUAS 3-15]WBP90423.1 hypothetical protein O1G21_34230 [Kitasatospora sp. HUAS 3-15]
MARIRCCSRRFYGALAVLGGRALAVVYADMTSAIALGVPLGNEIGALASWRWAFGFVALLALITIGGLAGRLPSVPGAAGLLARLPLVAAGFALLAALCALASGGQRAGQETEVPVEARRPQPVGD